MARRMFFPGLALTALVASGLSLATPGTVSFASDGSNPSDASTAVRYQTLNGTRQLIGSGLIDLFDVDDVSQTKPLPFPINFFGQKFTHLCATENGAAFPTNDPNNSSCYEYDYGAGELAMYADSPIMATLALDLDTSENLLLTDGRDANLLENTINGTTRTAVLAGGVLTVTSASHGLLAGDHVAFMGTNTVLDGMGSFPVTVIDANSFSVVATGLTDLDPSTGGTQTAVSRGVWAYSNGVGAVRSVYFGATTIGGQDAVVVTWYRVSHNDDDNPADRSSTLQLVLIKGSTGNDTVGWDFTVEYNIGTMTDDEDGYNAADPDDDCDAWSPYPGGDQRSTCRWAMGFASYHGGIGIESVTISAGTATIMTRTPHGVPVPSSGGQGVRLDLPNNVGLGGLSASNVWATVSGPSSFTVSTSAADHAANLAAGVNLEASDVYELFSTSSIAGLVDSGGSAALVRNSLNSNVQGRYRFGMAAGRMQSFAQPTMNGTPTVVDASLVSDAPATSTPGPVLPPNLPALVAEPVPTTSAPTVTTTTLPPTTTVAPSAPVPVPVEGGVLPALLPGVSQVLEDGVPAPVEVFVDNRTDLVLRGDGFEMSLAGECSFGCTIKTDAEGRQVLELEENGLARVEGEGFLPGTPVYVWLFSDPTFLGELTVNADGTFAGSVSIAGIEIGNHTLQVNGTSFDGKPRTANLGVLVSPEGVPSPLPTVLPSTGADAGLLVWVLLLTSLGGALVWATRRRSGAATAPDC